MGNKPKKILPHDDLEELAPGLWNVRGTLPIPLRRNMVVYRLRDGSLMLHSVIAMTDAGMAKLDTLGKPSIIVVPQVGHRMDAAFYRARYPKAQVICPAAARAKVEEVVKVDATCEDVLPPLGVVVHRVEGMKGHELAYEVGIEGGRALIVCDILANSDYARTWAGVLMGRITGGIKTRLGIARIVRLLLVSDKKAARASVERLADIPNLRLVSVAHGVPVQQDCAAAIREAVCRL